MFGVFGTELTNVYEIITERRAEVNWKYEHDFSP